MSSTDSYQNSKDVRADKFIEKAKNIHGSRFDYSEVSYTNAHTKVRIKCHLHGGFLQTPNNHLNGKGCPKCVRKIYDKDSFVKRANEVHGSKYDYSKATYVSARTKLTIHCPCHGAFEQTPSHHVTREHGCPECKSERIGDYRRLSKEVFVKRAKEAHGDKFDYSLSTYNNNRDKVLIICPFHGEFWQSPHTHVISIHGCPKCAPTSRYNEDAANVRCCAYFITFSVDGIPYEKIGITSRSIEERFRYECVDRIEVVYEKWGTYSECWEVEAKILEDNARSRYRTTGRLKGRVGGWSETFPLGVVDRDSVKKVFEKLID